MRPSLLKYKSIIKDLQKQVDDLERKVANKSLVNSEMVTEHQETDGESVTNQSPDSLLSNNINVVESKAVNAVKSLISKEKDRANRHLMSSFTMWLNPLLQKDLLEKSMIWNRLRQFFNKLCHLF